MLSQFASRLNNHRLRVSPGADSRPTGMKNRISRLKSPLKQTNLMDNRARNEELLNEHKKFGDQSSTRETASLDIERTRSSIIEDSGMHSKVGQDIDASPKATSSNDVEKETSQTLQSINGHENKEQRGEHEKTTLKRVTNVKHPFLRLRSPFRSKSSTSNTLRREKFFSDQKGCSNKINERATHIEDLKKPITDNKLSPGAIEQCNDNKPATSSSTTTGNEGSTQKLVEPLRKNLGIRDRKTVLKCCKSPNRKSLNACGDSKIEITCTKNQFKCNVCAGAPEEIITEQTHKKNASGNCRAQSCPKLGFIEKTSDEITHVSYVAMLNAEGDEFENIKRITARRLWGLEQQFNCKITLSERPLEMRARTVHKLEIQGASFREVAKCRNALPKFLIQKLTTKAESTVEEMHSRSPRRK